MKKYRDDVCKIGKCPNLDVCRGLCPALRYVNGKSESKEVLISNLINPEKVEFKDYKESLIELAEDRENRFMLEIEKIKSLVIECHNLPFYSRRKIAIQILLIVGFLKIDIAGFFNLSYRQIDRITKPPH